MLANGRGRPSPRPYLAPGRQAPFLSHCSPSWASVGACLSRSGRRDPQRAVPSARAICIRLLALLERFPCPRRGRGTPGRCSRYSEAILHRGSKVHRPTQSFNRGRSGPRRAADLRPPFHNGGGGPRSGLEGASEARPEHLPRPSAPSSAPPPGRASFAIATPPRPDPTVKPTEGLAPSPPGRPRPSPAPRTREPMLELPRRSGRPTMGPANKSRGDDSVGRGAAPRTPHLRARAAPVAPAPLPVTPAPYDLAPAFAGMSGGRGGRLPDPAGPLHAHIPDGQPPAPRGPGTTPPLLR
jgi:hypothetical protein